MFNIQVSQSTDIMVSLNFTSEIANTKVSVKKIKLILMLFKIELEPKTYKNQAFKS